MSTQKNKSLKAITLCLTAILLVAGMLLCLVACGGNDGPKPSHTQHSLGEWKTVTPATCTAEGIRERICSECDYKETDTIPAEHSLGGWNTTAPATCTANGTKEKSCSKCDYKETQSISATGHNYVDNLCKNCGKREFLFVPSELLASVKHFIAYGCSEDVEEWVLSGTLYNRYEEFSSDIICYCLEGEFDNDYVEAYFFGTEKEAADAKSFIEEEIVYNKTVQLIGKALVAESKEGLYNAVCGATLPSGAIDGDKLKFVSDAVSTEFADINIYSRFYYYGEGSFTLYSEQPSVGNNIRSYILTTADILHNINSSWDGEPTENIGGYYDGYIRRCGDAYSAFMKYKNGFIFDENEDDYAVIGYFYEEAFDSLEIPSTYNGRPVTEIYDRIFKDITCIEEVTIPSSIAIIGEKAFAGCTALKTVNWNAVHIERFSVNKRPLIFDRCPNIKAVNFGEEVSGIPDYLFEGCTEIEEIVLPDSVLYIGYRTFSGCTKLKSVRFSENLYNIGSYAFENCASLTVLTIPDSVELLGDYGVFAGCTELTKITIPFVGLKKDSMEPDRFFYRIFSDGGLYTSSTVPSSLKEVVVTGGTLLYNSAFSGGDSLTSITLPDSLVTIGDNVFDDCSALVGIVIPKNVTGIGQFAFYNCASLTSATILGDGTDIAYCSFSGCPKLMSVTIPKNATIRNAAFAGSDALEGVFFLGTAEEWNNVTIINETNNAPLLSATRYYYSEEQPTENGSYWHFTDGAVTVWAKKN